MDALVKGNGITLLADKLLFTKDDEVSISIFKFLTTTFQRHKLLKVASTELVERIRKYQKLNNDEEVNKAVDHLIETIDYGPRVDLTDNWVWPDANIIEALLELNSPKILQSNKEVDIVYNEDIPELKCSDEKPIVSLLHAKEANIPKVTLNEKIEYKQLSKAQVSEENEPKIMLTELIKVEEHKTNCDSPKIAAAAVPTVKIVKKFNPNIYIASVDKILKKYMDTNITDKKTVEGKAARNLLGLGMIEVNGIKKVTGCSSIRKLVEWYVSANDHLRTYSLLLYGISSTKYTEKFISIIHLLATKRMNYKVNNPCINDI